MTVFQVHDSRSFELLVQEITQNDVSHGIVHFLLVLVCISGTTLYHFCSAKNTGPSKPAKTSESREVAKQRLTKHEVAKQTSHG